MVLTRRITRVIGRCRTPHTLEMPWTSSSIISSQQSLESLENERNLSESEARRKAQAREDTLERELSDTQKKLSNETEETKKPQL